MHTNKASGLRKYRGPWSFQDLSGKTCDRVLELPPRKQFYKLGACLVPNEPLKTHGTRISTDQEVRLGNTQDKRIINALKKLQLGIPVRFANYRMLPIASASGKGGFICMSNFGSQMDPTGYFDLVFYPNPEHGPNYFKAAMKSLHDYKAPSDKFPGSVGVLTLRFIRLQIRLQKSIEFEIVQCQACTRRNELKKHPSADGRNLGRYYGNWRADLFKIALRFALQKGAHRGSFTPWKNRKLASNILTEVAESLDFQVRRPRSAFILEHGEM